MHCYFAVVKVIGKVQWYNAVVECSVIGATFHKLPRGWLVSPVYQTQAKPRAALQRLVFHELIIFVSPPLLQLPSRRRQAFTVKGNANDHKIDYAAQL